MRYGFQLKNFAFERAKIGENAVISRYRYQTNDIIKRNIEKCTPPPYYTAVLFKLMGKVYGKKLNLQFPKKTY